MSVAHDAYLETPNIITWNELSAQPWRNGGGVTRQILSRRRSVTGDWIPAADDWDWRLSIADVDTAGAFSSFPGMTRILTVIEGTSLTLTVDGAVEQLDRHQPFEFNGEAATSAELTHGPIRDLNLIARTSIVGCRVKVLQLTAGVPHSVPKGQYCVILEGSACLTLNDPGSTERDVELGRFDTVLGNAQHPPIITGNGILAVVTVTAIGSA